MTVRDYLLLRNGRIGKALEKLHLAQTAVESAERELDRVENAELLPPGARVHDGKRARVVTRSAARHLEFAGGARVEWNQAAEWEVVTGGPTEAQQLEWLVKELRERSPSHVACELARGRTIEELYAESHPD